MLVKISGHVVGVTWLWLSILNKIIPKKHILRTYLSNCLVILDELYHDPHTLCVQLMPGGLQYDILTWMDVFLGYNVPRQRVIMEVSVSALFLTVACVLLSVLWGWMDATICNPALRLDYKHKHFFIKTHGSLTLLSITYRYFPCFFFFKNKTVCQLLAPLHLILYFMQRYLYHCMHLMIWDSKKRKRSQK